AAECFAGGEHLAGGSCRIADQIGAFRAAHRLELLARGRRPTALAADFREHVRPAREEGILGFCRGLSDEAHRVDADRELLRRVSCLQPALAVEINQRAETLEAAAD